MQYARDRQGVELRGSVTPDTTWDLICRDLSRPVDEPYLRSGDLGQLLVACLEGRQLPEQMRDTIYQGMQDDLV